MLKVLELDIDRWLLSMSLSMCTTLYCFCFLKLDLSIWTKKIILVVILVFFDLIWLKTSFDDTCWILIVYKPDGIKIFFA